MPGRSVCAGQPTAETQTHCAKETASHSYASTRNGKAREDSSDSASDDGHCAVLTHSYAPTFWTEPRTPKRSGRAVSSSCKRSASERLPSFANFFEACACARARFEEELRFFFFERDDDVAPTAPRSEAPGASHRCTTPVAPQTSVLAPCASLAHAAGPSASAATERSTS